MSDYPVGTILYDNGESILKRKGGSPLRSRNYLKPTKVLGGLSNWLARRPVKPLPAGHVGSSPTPPIDTNFTFPGNSVGLECHLYTLEVGGSNPSSGTTLSASGIIKDRGLHLNGW